MCEYYEAKKVDDIGEEQTESSHGTKLSKEQLCEICLEELLKLKKDIKFWSEFGGLFDPQIVRIRRSG